MFQLTVDAQADIAIFDGKRQRVPARLSRVIVSEQGQTLVEFAAQAGRRTIPVRYWIDNTTGLDALQGPVEESRRNIRWAA